MTTGMLWFDNDKTRTLEEKVTRAAKYYLEKYGEEPTLCYVPTLDMPPQEKGKEVFLGGVKIRASATVLKNHLWLGVENA